MIASNLIELANANPDLKLFVVTSGGTIYGETSISGAHEAGPKRPISLYGELNVEIERSLRSSPAGCEGRICFLRLANPYGESRVGLSSRSFVDAAVAAARSQTPLTILGQGDQVRDFIHVDDAAVMIVKSALSVEPMPDALNIGSGVGHSLHEVTALIEKESGAALACVNAPARHFDVHVNVLDSTLAQNRTSFKPQPLEHCIQEMFAR
jgi:UDP-glucose 4-epimerase